MAASESPPDQAWRRYRIGRIERIRGMESRKSDPSSDCGMVRSRARYTTQMAQKARSGMSMGSFQEGERGQGECPAPSSGYEVRFATSSVSFFAAREA